MIISHKYKYLFVELPRTGSTAISNELIKNYDGEEILEKHSSYNDFLKIANCEEKKYFVFSCIRNPLDKVVSRYHKLKSNQQNPHNNIERLQEQNRKIPLGIFYLKKQYDFIHKYNANFSQYFLKFYKYPYSDWSILNHKSFDYIIYFEKINEDFEKVLKVLKIEIKRELPIINKTRGKDNNYLTYFNNQKLIKRAIYVFGLYMEMWNYSFPDDWGNIKIPVFSKIQLFIFNIFRKFYWKYLKS